MQIAIESTDTLTTIEGVPVHRLAVHKDEDAEQFSTELKEMGQPVEPIPLRNIL